MTRHDLSPVMKVVLYLSLALTVLSIVLMLYSLYVRQTQPGVEVADLVLAGVCSYVIAAGLGSYLPYPRQPRCLS